MKRMATTLIALCLHNGAYAGRPMDDAYGKWDDVTSITMVLSAKELPDGQPLTEAQLPDIGCTFVISEPMLVKEVLRIIHPAMFGTREKPAHLRHALYLSLKDPPGAKATYLIAEQQGAAGTVGSMYAPSIRAEPLYFAAKPEMLEQLRGWARVHLPLLSVTPPRSDLSNPCTFLP